MPSKWLQPVIFWGQAQILEVFLFPLCVCTCAHTKIKSKLLVKNDIHIPKIQKPLPERHLQTIQFQKTDNTANPQSKIDNVLFPKGGNYSIALNLFNIYLSYVYESHAWFQSKQAMDSHHALSEANDPWFRHNNIKPRVMVCCSH